MTRTRGRPAIPGSARATFVLNGSVWEQFRVLVPSGERGRAVSSILADWIEKHRDQLITEAQARLTRVKRQTHPTTRKLEPMGPREVQIPGPDDPRDA